MITQIIWLRKQANVLDIYVCMSSQTVSEVRTSANGFEFRIGIRSKAGAHSLRSLFLDVDVKPGAYATTEDALKALKTFLGATTLPRPTMIVATGGGGFHCHWVLDRHLTPAEWLPLAKALNNA